ncbi:hypothetical protein D3C84_753020 [compost metagenome]
MQVRLPLRQGLALGDGIQFTQQVNGQVALAVLLGHPRHQQAQQPALTACVHVGPCGQPGQRRLHPIAVGLRQSLGFQGQDPGICLDGSRCRSR